MPRPGAGRPLVVQVLLSGPQRGTSHWGAAEPHHGGRGAGRQPDARQLYRDIYINRSCFTSVFASTYAIFVPKLAVKSSEIWPRRPASSAKRPKSPGPGAWMVWVYAVDI